MVDILIYTRKETLEHKKKVVDDPTYFCYWRLGTKPRNVKVGDRIYFATDGKIRGSFEITAFYSNEIHWNPKSWKPVDIEERTTHFKGFKYLPPNKTKGLYNGKKD